MKKNFYILDGTALLYRSYFAFMNNPLINSKGFNTGALFGFSNSVIKILEDCKPDYVAVSFDEKAPTFRHEIYSAYKATREKMPEELILQVPYSRKIIDAFNIPVYVMAGFESDDIMATLAKKGKEAGLNVFMVSGDKDMMQLIDEEIKMYTPKRDGGMELIDGTKVFEKYGVKPEQMVDFLSVMGDASDNIPGIEGIGEKKASKYLSSCGSLDTIYSFPEKIENPKDREKFLKGKESALFSRQLVKLKDDLLLEFDPQKLVLSKPDIEKITRLFVELEFSSLIKKFKVAVSEEVQKYETVSTFERLELLIEEFSGVPFFIIDTETNGIDLINSRIVGISISHEEKKAYYIPFNLRNFGPREKIFELLKPLLTSEKIKKGGQNTKFDLHMFRNEGIEVRGITFDTIIAASMLNPQLNQKNLDVLAFNYLNYKKIPTDELLGKGKNTITMEFVPIEKVAIYACEDADITLRLKNLFELKLKEQNLFEVFEKVEIPLIEILLEMERNGVAVNSGRLREFSVKMEKRIYELENDLYKMAGEHFNLNSPKQLSEILFIKMKIHEKLGIKKLKKTKTGISTDVNVLEMMEKDPFVALILEYRKLAKLKSTYVDALPALVNPKTGRIHTSFNQFVAATGRLSSTDPNLQNIPIKGVEGKEMRECFIPGRADYLLLSADYSQIELRVLAHLCEEPSLIEAFEKNEDIHARTAAKLFNLPIENVPKELRSQAKTVNFGVLYGMGPKRLASENNISITEAKNFIDNYFTHYAKVKEFIDNQIEIAKMEGKVSTIMGRTRPVPEILNSSKRTEIFGEHVAVNTPIQGSAADLIKIAMKRISDKLKTSSLRAYMILQVHDELVFEVHKDDSEELGKMVKYEMENALKLKVPLKVDIGIGQNWFEAH